jgi:hypothetical protein
VKRFRCSCGLAVFFDDYACTGCGAQLGYAPELSAFLARPAPQQAFVAPEGSAWKACRNRIDHRACNWLLRADDPLDFCLACRLNRVIPNLATEHNLRLWRRTEQAKRRLVYSLINLGLPREAGDARPPLRFEFLEDQRSNPDVAESLVMTGHRAGIITVNLLEADDVARHVVREQMAERYRTLLGHFRHESGHYYEPLLVPPGPARDAYRALFGDERLDYDAALARYHAEGPDPGWNGRCISPYASAHPMEDWAETWAHYLHISDALETARATGLIREAPTDDWEAELALWIPGAVSLNEMARSLGLDDPYPFVITPPVRAKLGFIHQRLAAARQDAAAAAATR